MTLVPASTNSTWVRTEAVSPSTVITDAPVRWMPRGARVNILRTLSGPSSVLPNTRYSESAVNRPRASLDVVGVQQQCVGRDQLADLFTVGHRSPLTRISAEPAAGRQYVSHNLRRAA